MKTTVLCAVVSLICSLFAINTAIVENGTQEEILCEIQAATDTSGKLQTITVTGKRFAPDSQYFTDITIRLSDGRNIIPDVNEGYGAGVAAFDFLGKGYCQLFYFASSGGSGGYGYFYVYDCAQAVRTLFDFEKFENRFTAKYADGYALQVLRDQKLFVTYNMKENEYAKDLWNDKGILINHAEPSVSYLNFVEPVFVYTMNRYRLNVWQKVTGIAQVDVVGHIITTIDLADDNTGFVSLAVS